MTSRGSSEPAPAAALSGTAAAAPRSGRTRLRLPTTKQRIPETAGLLPRHRLLDRLRTAATLEGEPVILVAAPAGYGKTSLLAGWASAREADGCRVAWLTLDSYDDDAHQLWCAILDALEAAADPAGRSAFRELQPPPGGIDPAFLAAVDRLVDDVPGGVTLVLDDLHEITSRPTLESLELLLRHRPRNLYVVLSSRGDPPLGLHRLRLQKDLAEVRADVLALDEAEAQELLRHDGLALTPEQQSRLLALTEGWAAGLRLVALSAQGAADLEAVLAGGARGTAVLADYLVGEVLSRLPGDMRGFLMETSVCDEVSAECAAELTGRRDAGRILDSLARSNAMVWRTTSRTDGGEWFRYHGLLRAYLQAELERVDITARPRLHAAAARWFAARAEPLVALGHAATAGDGLLVAEILRTDGVSLVLDGAGPRVRRALAAVPEGQLARPAALVGALAALDAADLPAADRLLAAADGADSGDARTSALEFAVRLRRARISGTSAEVLERFAAGGTTVEDQDVDLLRRVNRGAALLWRGDAQDAEADVLPAFRLALARARPAPALEALTLAAAAAAVHGHYGVMSARAEAAVRFATRHGWSGSWRCAHAYALAAWGAYQRLDDARASRHAQAAAALMTDATDPEVALSVRSMVERIRFDAEPDPRPGVAARLERLRHYAGTGAVPALVGHVAVELQRQALRVSEPGWAEEAAVLGRTAIGAGAEPAYLDAVVQAQRGQRENARRSLVPVLRGELPVRLPTVPLLAWTLEAVLCRHVDDYRAHEALCRALALAANMRALRPLVWAGEPVRDLLLAGRGRFGRHEPVAAQVLAALPAPAGPLPEPLTPRELQLLAELPSMRTDQEISEALLISVNTVKTHLRGVYRKLGVGSRREAVAAAREQGLL